VTDDELMLRGANGDDDAFRILVERWQRPVFAFLERMTGSREEAQDLAQETFMKVIRGARAYEPSGRFRSWLFRIAGNLAWSSLRRRRILEWIPFVPGRHDPAAGDDAERSLELDETRRAVRSALAKLPPRQRQATILRVYDEQSYREIAEIMDTTVPAVESLLQRAMFALRGHLAHAEGEK
jgi:RNA polymerase sigma-70 factor (ECF subfamily)